MRADVEPLSPEPLEPVRRPLMRQSWNDLTFIHWPYRAPDLQRVVPAELEIDTFAGNAWVGLVPFKVSGLTLPKAPALPWLSSFPETNLRTYVIDQRGRRGVWFFSLDAARLAAVAAARFAYSLPYYWARMEVSSDDHRASYKSVRREKPEASTDIEVKIGQRIVDQNDLQIFLTARFRLFAQRNSYLIRADVAHKQWDLRRASPSRIEETLTRAAGLPEPRGEPLVHFSKSIDVLVSRAFPLM